MVIVMASSIWRMILTWLDLKSWGRGLDVGCWCFGGDKFEKISTLCGSQRLASVARDDTKAKTK
jgi:hypothetical protein